jgi:hypothetical protein
MPSIKTLLRTLHSTPPPDALAYLAHLDWITLTTHTFEAAAHGWYCTQVLQFSALTDAYAVAPLFALSTAESEDEAREECAKRLVECVGEWEPHERWAGG